jgi:hypothetical protein
MRTSDGACGTVNIFHLFVVLSFKRGTGLAFNTATNIVIYVNFPFIFLPTGVPAAHSEQSAVHYSRPRVFTGESKSPSCLPISSIASPLSLILFLSE